MASMPSSPPPPPPPSASSPSSSSSSSSAAKVEALVAHIHGLSGSQADLDHLHSILKQDDENLRSSASLLGSFLPVLDPSTHSLGYLYFLEAHTFGPISLEENTGFLTMFVSFVNSCSSEQIRMAPDKFVTLCKRFKDHIIQLGVPMQGIAPMRMAILKLQSSFEHLTILHTEFLLLCLLAKCYKASLSILEHDIYEIDQQRNSLLYCYYGGMIYIGLKRFPKALEFLHNAFTSPMSSISPIALEAYKKYVLVSLIHNGQVPQLPKYASTSAQRYLKTFSKAYIDLGHCFGTGKISELQKCFDEHSDTFHSENNLGLVKQVISSLYKRNIQRLTQTYLTLSLQDIADTVGLETSEQAEMHVLQMIQDGEIFATINQKDGMVSFLEDPEQYKSCQMIEQIDSCITRMMAVAKKLSSVDEIVACDATYLSKAGRERTRLDFDELDPQKYTL